MSKIFAFSKLAHFASFEPIWVKFRNFEPIKKIFNRNWPIWS